MTVKRKDFQKTAAYVQEFLLKLSEDVECAELRDALNLALLHMQKYYRLLQGRLKENNGNHTFRSSVRGLSPMTPFKDAPDKFQWRWINLENPRISMSITMDGNEGSTYNLPTAIQAARSGEMTWMQELVERDVHVINDLDGIGRTPLMYSVHHQQLHLTKYLIDMGADINAAAHDGSTVLHVACHEGYPGAIKLLLDADCDHHAQDNFGRAPIHWAVVTPSTKGLELLILKGTNVNIRDKDGLSPCMWACRLDHIEHFEKLSAVDNQNIDEADGIERDNSGRTWMHWAVRRTEPLECLRTLLTQETAVIKDDDGKTVMLIAAETGSLPACKVIIEIAGGYCVHDRDDHDRNPLHLAAMGGHGEVCNYLLEKGADLESRDKYNATSWEYARNRQLHYCMLILASHQRQRARGGSRTPESDRGGYGLRKMSLDLDSEVMSHAEESSNISENTFKPITPPRPPKEPPPNRGKSPRGLAMKRPLRSSSLTSSDNFEFREQGEKDAKLRSKSLDAYHPDIKLLQDWSSLTESRVDLTTPSERLSQLDSNVGENLSDDLESNNDNESYKQSVGQEHRDKRGSPEKDMVNGDIFMSLDEAEDDEITITAQQNGHVEPGQPFIETPNGEIEEENVSMDEMDVSDLDGEDSDQATVIHRPTHQSQTQQQLLRYQPHPPTMPNKPPTNYHKTQPEEVKTPPRYVAGPGEEEVDAKEDELKPVEQYNQPTPPKLVPSPNQRSGHPVPVPIPRGRLQNRANQPNNSPLTPPRSPSQKVPLIQSGLPGRQTSPARQVSPKLQTSGWQGSPSGPSRHNLVGSQSTASGRQLSPGRLTQRSSGERSSSQTSRSSTELDQTVHEIGDDILGPPFDYKLRNQAPLTPPESKRRPPLPPQLMPLHQPRMPGSHLQLPPATKPDKKKKKKKKKGGLDSGSYIAPLNPPSDLQPSIRSANLYNRSKPIDRLFQDGAQNERDSSSHASLSNAEPHFNQRMNNAGSQETLASIDSLDGTGPFTPDESSYNMTSQGNSPGRGGQQSTFNKQNGPMPVRSSFPGPHQRVQSGCIAPRPRARTARSQQPAFQGELPPQIEGHKVGYARGPGRAPPHLAPPSYSTSHNQH